jgi:hypothetical protein
VPPHLQSELSESQARRASALRSALGPLVAFLDDPHLIEVMLNADGVVWVEKLGERVLRTPVVMPAADAERMLRLLVASEVLVELNPQQPSLSAKLPAPWGARLPGVRPRVQLLLELRTAGRIRRGRDLFAYLGRTGRDPSGLADPLYVRVSAVLGGRLPAHTILLALLLPHRPAPGRAFARTGIAPQKADIANRKATPIEFVEVAAGSQRQARRTDT